MSATAKASHEVIKAYMSFDAELSSFRESVQFDYEDKDGNKAARSHIHKLRQIKGAVEQARKDEKAASLAYGRLVDSQASKIKDEIDRLIAVHYVPLQEIAARETLRVESLQARLAWFSRATVTIDEEGNAYGSNYLLSKLAEVRAVPLDDSWEEFLAEAGQAKDAAISALERDAAASKVREEDAAELQRLREAKAESENRAERQRIEEAAAQRVRNELAAKEKAEREAAETEQRRKDEAHEQALRDAADKLKAQQEVAERRELQLKLDAEKKERERLAEEDRKRRELEDRQRDEVNRSNKHDEIAAYLITRGVTAKQATIVVGELASGNVPHVSINY